MGAIDIVSASAGSGKTYNMSYRYVRTLIQNPTLYRHILAVTFTNKATDELKERILKHLHTLALGCNEKFEEKLLEDTSFDSAAIRSRAAEARSLILHDYNNFAVMTIDKFFQRIMRSFIKELDVDLNFNLELQTDSLLARAADNMLDQLSDEEHKDLRSWVLDFIGEKIDDGHEWDIRKGLISLGKELFKEEYREAEIKPADKPLLRKIIKQSSARADKSAKQYTDSAKSFIDIMNANGLLDSDFKGGSRGVASYVQKVASGQLIKPSTAALNALNNGEWRTKTSPKAALIDSLIPELTRALQLIVEAYPEAIMAENTSQALSRYYRDFALLANLREALNDICEKEDILPISDVNDLINKLISDNEAPFIYEKSGNRYSHFMIDEFQDTSTMQWRNFVPLLHNAVSQSEDVPVMLVGDVKQSIYRWRGGDWSLLAHGVQKEFKEVNTSSLLENYRSRPNVVKFNNELMAHAIDWLQKRVDKSLDEAHNGGFISAELRRELSKSVTDAYSSFRQEPKDNSDKGYATILLYEKPKKESKEENDGEESESTTPWTHPILERICELQDRGYHASDIAILVRTNAEAKRIAEMLLNFKLQPGKENYVFDVVTQEALEIGASATVRFIVACMGIGVNPNDRISLATYNKYLNRSFESQLEQEEAEFLTSLALMQPEEAFNKILLNYTQCSAENEIPYIQAFHSQIINYCSRKIADTALFLQWWNESGYKEYIALPQGANAITIATIHKAKGLGYKVVLLPYCHWTVAPKPDSTFWAAPNTPMSDRIRKFPVIPTKELGASHFSHSYYTEQTLTAIDAINTLYVALTRAQEELHIMVDKSSNQNSVGKIFTSYVGEQSLYEYGTSQRYEPKEDEEQEVTKPSKFHTYSPEGKLAVRYSHQRYDEESRGELLSPREMGTLMHKVFENATSLMDAERSIAELANGGDISLADANLLRANIASAMEREEVKMWFDGSWEEVYVEREIIADGRANRPDRVMTRGGEAVVVDYKFGLEKPASHVKQIRAYSELPQQMGYESVRGYLWYISTGEIIQITSPAE